MLKSLALYRNEQQGIFKVSSDSLEPVLDITTFKALKIGQLNKFGDNYSKDLYPKLRTTWNSRKENQMFLQDIT